MKVSEVRGIRIRDFRTFRDVTLEFAGSLIVITGPNNAGKSTLLEVLKLYPALAEAARGGRSAANLGNTLADTDFEVGIGIDLCCPEALDMIRQTDRIAAGSEADHLLQEWPKFLEAELGSSMHWLDFTISGDKATAAKFDLTGLQRTTQNWRNGIARVGGPYAKWLSLLGGDSGASPSENWRKGLIREFLGAPVEARHIQDVRRAADQPISMEHRQELAIGAAMAATPFGGKRAQWAREIEQVLIDVFGDGVGYEVTPNPETGGDISFFIDGQVEVPIEHVGAGVREVFVTAYLALKPGKRGGPEILCIEEPENCLHPAAARRLVQSLARRKKVQLFVATHSPSVVGATPDSVIQVERSHNVSSVRSVKHAQERFAAIRALGASPADLVLTPCALWVEGPTDRLYLSSWLASLGIQEGVHYQAMFYGGSLAKHVSVAGDSDGVLAAIRPLGRRTIVVADSDRPRKGAQLKPHVLRWKHEAEDDSDLMVCVTSSREMENYLGADLVNELRTERGLPKIAVGRSFRFERVYGKGLDAKLTKVQLAQAALAKLDGGIPADAVSMVNSISTFILESQ